MAVWREIRLLLAIRRKLSFALVFEGHRLLMAFVEAQFIKCFFGRDFRPVRLQLRGSYGPHRGCNCLWNRHWEAIVKNSVSHIPKERLQNLCLRSKT